MQQINIRDHLAAAIAALKEDASRGREYLMSIIPELGKGQADRLAAMAQGVIMAETMKTPSDSIDAAILSALRMAGVHGTTVVELASKVSAPEKRVSEILVSLQARKYMIEIDYPCVRLKTWVDTGNKVKVDVRRYADMPDFTIGLIADTHLGSKFARTDVMEAMYDHFARENCTFVYHLGNLIDGYRQHLNAGDLLPGMDRLDNQVEYAVDVYPQREGITTRFLTADCHEGWWIKPNGINIGDYIEGKAERKGRDDLRWLGHMEVDVAFQFPKGAATMRLVHPGDGSAYAASYPMQRLVESYATDDTPQILATGHYHKYLAMRYRECHIVMAGCCQDQSPFMRKKKIQAHVGGMIIRCKFDERGSVIRFAPEWFPFSTVKYYEQNMLYLPI
ncbi:MAG: hypothetical protein WC495_06325 [Patescibacteria group bacterium]